MPDQPPAPRSLLPKVGTYLGGSVIAAGCSEVTLLVLYGLLDVDPAPASVVAWLAGAVPNYWLNRSWTWQRRGRPSLRREVLPYVVIVLLTLLLATLGTSAVDSWLRSRETADGARVVLVAAAFVSVYVVMAALRFVLLDRLFTRPERLAEAPGAVERTP